MKEDRLNKMQSMIGDLARQFLIEASMEIASEFGLITVTNIKLASDMSYLDIYVSSMKNKETLCKALSQFDYAMIKRMNAIVQLRKTPRIRFRYDEEGEISQNITSLINSLDIPKED